MIPGDSNDERLTDIDTCNCYIENYAFHEALLHAFTYALCMQPVYGGCLPAVFGLLFDEQATAQHLS